MLHDPQTAGLIRPMVDAGLRVEWVCHVGVDRPTDVVRSTWDFLREDVEAAHAYVFLTARLRLEGLARRSASVVPPCIDPTSPKNVEVPAFDVNEILQAAGVQGGEAAGPLELAPGGDRAESTRRLSEGTVGHGAIQ